MKPSAPPREYSPESAAPENAPAAFRVASSRATTGADAINTGSVNADATSANATSAGATRTNTSAAIAGATSAIASSASLSASSATITNAPREYSRLEEVPTSGAEIRYAQCWEDADVLLQALDVQAGDECVSIASGGDNTLALLTCAPRRVVALDRNPAQLACLELRAAAYARLSHREMLQLLGSVGCAHRGELFARCRPDLSPWARNFWDERATLIENGIGHAGRFERYFSLFRRRVLPLVHSPRRVARVLAPMPRREREWFFRHRWNTARWRLMFRVFFSRALLARLGRDAASFRYVEGRVAARLEARTRRAFTILEPACNPYLQWILAGRHTSALPFALREENFGAIRDNLHRLELRCDTLENFVRAAPPGSINRFGCSDVFEYHSLEETARVLADIARAGKAGGRVVYWNMLAPRSRPETLAHRLKPLRELAQTLHARDRACFYSALVIEEILP